MYGSRASSLWATINASKRAQETLLVAIDGCGGSGKSTLAEELRRQNPQTVTVVHMDDFYKSSEQRGPDNGNEAEAGGNFDWRRAGGPGRGMRFHLAAAIVSALTFPIVLTSFVSGLVTFVTMYLFLLIFSAPVFLIGGTLVSYCIEACKDKYLHAGRPVRYAVSLAAYAAGGAIAMVLYVSFVLRRLQIDPFDYLIWIGAGAGIFHYHVLLLLKKVREKSK